MVVTHVTPGYNRSVTRPSLYLFLALVAMAAGCNRPPQNEAVVRQALMDHLRDNVALDLNQLDVAVNDVKFNGNQATANVAFKPKSAPDQGMSMSYTLERRGEKWTVSGKGSGHGGAMGSSAGAPSPSGEAAGEVPPGHPPVNGSGSTAGGKASDLPPGHPPVNAPATPKK